MMPSQEEYQQFVDKVKEGLTQRLEAVSLSLDDAGLMGEGEEAYVFVGWASRPITCERVQFRLDFTAAIAKDMDVDPMVGKLAAEITEYFFNDSQRKLIH